MINKALVENNSIILVYVIREKRRRRKEEETRDKKREMKSQDSSPCEKRDSSHRRKKHHEKGDSDHKGSVSNSESTSSPVATRAVRTEDDLNMSSSPARRTFKRSLTNPRHDAPSQKILTAAVANPEAGGCVLNMPIDGPSNTTASKRGSGKGLTTGDSRSHGSSPIGDRSTRSHKTGRSPKVSKSPRLDDSGDFVRRLGL